jgi:hypothetical protein
VLAFVRSFRSSKQLLLIPAVFFVLQEGFKIAIETEPIMTADGTSTGWAAPFFFLAHQKRRHANLLDRFQVFDHAHVILCAVALIQTFTVYKGNPDIQTNRTNPFPQFAQFAICVQFLPLGMQPGQ